MDGAKPSLTSMRKTDFYTKGVKQRSRRYNPPKEGLFWCWGCDGNLIGEKGKCSNCGYRNGKRKRK